jgi:hypothetical protein
LEVNENAASGAESGNIRDLICALITVRILDPRSTRTALAVRGSAWATWRTEAVGKLA